MRRLTDIKYIEDKEELGILYDWGLIFKEYKKLKIPKGYYNPCYTPIEKVKYIIELSERSTGKTTNWLIIGMFMNALYGTIIQYIRQNEDMVSPSHAVELVKVLTSYNNGYYIRYITNGEYNSIYYHWKRFYYCHIDEDGRRDKTATEPFIQVLTIDRNLDYKSTYNAPKGDLIIYDEFIGKYYPNNEAVDFLDLHKTIRRDRLSPITVMLANTISVTSPYFREFEVSKEVRKLKKGESTIVTTEKGTRLYIEILGLKQNRVKDLGNRLFYGFNNPKLASITGEGVFAFEAVPHIRKDDTDKLITRHIYIESASYDLFNIEIVNTEKYGLCVHCHPATKTYEDSIILTANEVLDRRYRYGLGFGNLCKLIYKLYIRNLWFYDSNETGSIINDFILNAKKGA